MTPILHPQPPSALPADSAERKAIPLARGALDYFPAALAAVADLSRAGNEKHNPGEDLHWSRGKSNDHADCLLRHLVDRGTTDPEDGIPHSVKVAWRALALLQEELEAQGAPLARGAKVDTPESSALLSWEDACNLPQADERRKEHARAGVAHSTQSVPDCPVCANERQYQAARRATR